VNPSRILVALGAILVLGAVDYSIVRKESIVREGEIVFLEMAPRDPRSLMQGDYMSLRFRIASELAPKATASGGFVLYAPITIDERRIAHLAPPGATSPYRLRYRIRQNEAWLGTNAFFFEEGTAERYAKARYGEFRLDVASGEAILVGLSDEKLQPLR
jgi:uncharacterized membrane-anchored protein